MRLVVATPLYPPEIGGPATYAKLLEEALLARGTEVEVVKFSDVRHLPKVVRHYRYYRRVLCAARKADGILALDPVSVGLPTCVAAWRAKKPFVVKVVGDYAWEQGRQRFGVTVSLDEFITARHMPLTVRILRRIEIGVATRARLIIVPSGYLKNIVVAWGVSSEKVEVIYNAVSFARPGVAPEAVAKLPRPLIMSAGRLVPWKHMNGVIDAVALVREKGIEASLVIVGDGPERVSLEENAKKKLGRGYVFTGALTHVDTLATMKSSDAFVLNSSYEGFSHLLIEALALGVPTIATRVGGNPEIIADGEDGILIAAGDTHALFDALSRLLAEQDMRARLSARSQKSVTRFSVEAMIERTSAILTGLFGAGSRA